MKRIALYASLTLLLAGALFWPAMPQSVTGALSRGLLQARAWTFSALQTLTGGVTVSGGDVAVSTDGTITIDNIVWIKSGYRPGPVAAIALTADNHSQAKTWTDYQPLIDEYNIPFTPYPTRWPDGSGEGMTATHLQEMIDHPLVEVGTHSGYHTNASWYSRFFGYVGGGDQTLHGYGQGGSSADFSNQAAVDDIVWLYGQGGPAIVDSITNEAHLELDDAPGANNQTQRVHVVKNTELGNIKCDGTEFACIAETCAGGNCSTGCVTLGTDPNDNLYLAPTFGATGLGGIIWIDGSTSGNPYYVLDYDNATNVMTLNRACTDGGAFSVYHLGASFDGLGNSLTASDAEIASDIGLSFSLGDISPFRTKSFGAGHNVLSAQQAMVHASRGLKNNAATEAVFSGAVPYTSFNRFSTDRRGFEAHVTPQVLRNWVEAVIEAESALILNLESGPEAHKYSPTGTISGVATDKTFTCVGCDFTDTPCAAGDIIIIDDPSVTRYYEIDSVTDATNIESLTASESTFSGADFWVIDETDAYIGSQSMGSTEALFKYLDENRDRIVALTHDDLVKHAMRFAGAKGNFNLVQNPFFEITEGEWVSGCAADICADAKANGDNGRSTWAPWKITTGAAYVTRVERFGTPMLKIDTSAGSQSVKISQDIYVMPNQDYMTWAEVEVESATSIDSLMTRITGLAGCSQGWAYDDTECYSSEGTHGLDAADVAAEEHLNTYALWMPFSTARPEQISGVVDGTDAGHASFDASRGFAGLDVGMHDDGYIEDHGLNSGTYRVYLPGHSTAEPSVSVTSMTEGYACGLKATTQTYLDITCTDLTNGLDAEADFQFVVHRPVGKAVSTGLLNRRAIEFQFYLIGQGVFYLRPVVIVEDTNWINK